jgi:hypothetical protein
MATLAKPSEDAIQLGGQKRAYRPPLPTQHVVFPMECPKQLNGNPGQTTRGCHMAGWAEVGLSALLCPPACHRSHRMPEMAEWQPCPNHQRVPYDWAEEDLSALLCLPSTSPTLRNMLKQKDTHFVIFCHQVAPPIRSDPA